MVNPRSRPHSTFWVFTVNNPNVSMAAFAAMIKNVWDVRYAVFQSEVGDNGTPHFQGTFKILFASFIVYLLIRVC